MCCGGVWYTESGVCCKNVWYPTANPCPEGEVYFPGFAALECCGCYPEMIFDGREQEEVELLGLPLGDLCCDCVTPNLHLIYSEEDGVPIGCTGRCCTETENGPVCTQTVESLCEGDWTPGCCLGEGCPYACCSEDSDGLVTCDPDLGILQCTAPSVLAEGNDCETGCLGLCCIDGEPHEQTTQAACDDLGGCWAGLGSTECLIGCRDPFTNACCESAYVTDSAGLTFTQPRFKRCPPFAETLRVTVTGYTDSPILIHGTPLGQVGKRCPINHSFLLCWDKFNVEPAPCDTDLICVDLTVCWEEEATDAETLNFSGCNGLTVWLGACAYGCITTMVYSGAGHTSNAIIELHGDGVIVASGSAPLVLTESVVHAGTCPRTLTLSGTNTGNNEIGLIPNGPGTSVKKTGVGTWRFDDNHQFSGQLLVLAGTLVIGSSVSGSGNSPFGTNTTLLPAIGDATAAVGFAKLIAEGVTISRGFSVVDTAGQVVVIGSVGNAIFASGISISLGGPVTLQAATSTTATFANSWAGAGGTVTVGSAGNDGTVVVESQLPSVDVDVVAGTLVLYGTADIIDPAFDLSITDSRAELQSGATQTVNKLTIGGNGVCDIDSGSTLTTDELSGSGDLEKDGDGGMVVTGANDLSGEVSILAGSLQIQQIVSGPAIVNTATFTNTTLTVAFSSTPSSGQQFRLLAGSTFQTYTPTLTGAGAATATYNSTNSTLTIT